MLLLTLALACSGNTKAPADDSSRDDSGRDDSAVSESSVPDDTGEVTLGACEAPAALPDDPLTQVGQLMLTQTTRGGFFVELIDLEVEGDRVYAVGQGGLMIYDVSDPAAPALLGAHPTDRQQQNSGRYHRVEVLGEDLLAVTHRDVGLAIVDVSDPSDTVEIYLQREAGLEGLAAWDDKLAVTVRGEGVRVYDVSDPTNPQLLGSAAGLETPWEMTPVVDGWSYVADNSLGVVPVNLSDPSAPVIGDPVDLDGATLHVAVDGDHLYASQGSYGVVVLERGDPAAPTVVGRAQSGGSAVMASANDGWLWVVDHEAVSAFDISDPANPAQRGHQITEQFALAVRGVGERAWVGDWNILGHWQVHPEVAAPQLDLSTDLIALPTEGGEASVTLFNRGAAALTVSGGAVDDAQVSLAVSARVIPPGGSATATLRWEGGDSLDARLCLASDDPDHPTLETPVIAGDFGEHVGRPAPDFELLDLDGERRVLSEQLGSPVLLAYFATW